MDSAYVAGFVDGEGCIYASMSINSVGAMRTRIGLRIVNTNKEVIDEINKQFTGYRQFTKRANPNWKDIYSINYEGAPLKLILEEILPDLIVKKRLAEIALEMLELIGYDRSTYPKRLELVSEIKSINKRGA